MCVSTMRVLLLPIALASAATNGGTSMKPVITTDIIYGTIDLLSTIHEEVYGRAKAAAAPLTAPAMKAINEKLPKDLLEEACSKVGMKKKDVMGHVTKAQDAFAHAKAISASQFAKVYGTSQTMVDRLVTMLEKKLPKYTGLIPKTPEDFLIFVVYISSVLYVCFRVLFFLLHTALSIYCFICCCGCCCRRRKPAAEAAKKGKAADKGKTAAAATAATAKASAKKAAKK